LIAGIIYTPTEAKAMIVGDQLRALRERKKFSQGEIEKRTGLLRGYISRVENGHTAPSVETIEKFARALEVPMYQLFFDGEESSNLPNLPKRKTTDDFAWGSSGRNARWLSKFRRFLSRIEAKDRKLLMLKIRKMVRAKVD
jgi:transcriptional regulator with XRE-family HTH domain